jgi:hypothetical protein
MPLILIAEFRRAIGRRAVGKKWPIFPAGRPVTRRRLPSGALSWKSRPMTRLNGDSTVQHLEALVSAPMGDELAMMDLETGKYLVLDRIGAVIWEELDEPIRVRDLVDGLQARFEVDRDRCEADVLTFLRQLQDKGLLRVSDD